MAMPLPFSRIGERMRHDGNPRAEERRHHLAAEERLVPRIVRMSDERDAGGDQLGPRRVDLDEGRRVRRFASALDADPASDGAARRRLALAATRRLRGSLNRMRW